MARTQIRGNTQIIDATVTLAKLQDNFIAGATWNLDTANTATITGLQDPINANDATNKAYVDGLISSAAKGPDGYATLVSGDYPQAYKGNAIQEGDSFYITDITNGTAVGLKNVNLGDMLVALVDLEIANLPAQATAGAGLVQNGINFDIVSNNNGIVINANDIVLTVGSTNGNSLEITATGVELASTISGARIFSGTVTVQSDLTVSTNATISGNLNVSGNTTLGTTTKYSKELV